MSDVDDAGPIRLLNGADVDHLASVPLALEAAESAARLDREKVATGRLQVNGHVSWSRILSGSITDLDVFGYKEFHRVGKRVRYHIQLYRESTGNALDVHIFNLRRKLGRDAIQTVRGLGFKIPL